MARLQLLGPVDLRDDTGSELTQLLGQTKRFAVLAYLAGNAPKTFHRRDRLFALFWPESTTKQARHGLRQVLYELRNHLGENSIVSRGANEIALNEDIVTCDVAQMHSAIAAGDLGGAIELYGGDFLDGFFVSGAPEVEEWIENRRAELRRRCVEVSWQLVKRYEVRGDLDGAIAGAQRAIALTPTDEVGVRRLLTLLRRQRNAGEALRVYDELVRLLANQFGAEPSPETTELLTQIREQADREPGQTTRSPSIAPSEVAETDSPIDAVEFRSPTAAGAEPIVATPLNHPVAVAAIFGLVSLGILTVVNILVPRLGLPDWVLHAAVALLVVGLPIIVATAVVERQRISRADRTVRHWLTWRRSLRGGGLAFASLATVTAGFMATRAAGIGPIGTLMAKGVFQERGPILLADFVNRTAQPTLATTVTELLRIDLTQSRVVRLIDPDAVTDARQRMMVAVDTPLDETAAREVAAREGVQAVLAGDVASVGRGYVVSTKLIRAVDGELLGTERVTAKDDAGLIAAIDQLSARWRGRIGESLKDIRASPPLARVTTTSLPALRLYTQAMRYAGPAGVPLLEQAVALDTTFAMAYRRLGVVLRRVGRSDDARTAVRRAFELRDHLPDVERYIVTGLYYSNVDYDSARIETAYRAALALDPDNYIALVNLADHLSLSRQWAARESLAVRSVTERRTLVGFLNVLSAQLLQRKYAEAQVTIDDYARSIAVPSNWQFDLEAATRQYDRAEQVLRADTAGPDLQRLGDLMRLRGRVGAAREAFRTIGDTWSSLHHLALLAADFGLPSDAVRLLESYRADSLAPLDGHQLERAELYAAVGQVDRAHALIRELEQHVDSDYLRHPAIRRDMLRVSGEIALSEARYKDAVADFAMVNALAAQCTTCGLARLAQAWDRSGHPDSAVSVYQRMLDAPLDRLNEDDVRWLPDTYKRLGELYEARYDTTNAITYYQEFVELWKNADRSLQPVVERVKGRIVSLGGDAQPS